MTIRDLFLFVVGPAAICTMVLACVTTRGGAAAFVSTPLPQGHQYTQISVDGEFSGCALRNDGQIVCWGEPIGGQDPPAGKFVYLDMGRNCACGIREDGSLACWGTGPKGSPGWHENLCKPIEGSFLRVDVGDLLHCGVTSDRVAVCWDGNSHFLAWAEPSGFADVVVGDMHVCYLTTEGKAACYGLEAPGCMSAPQGRYRQITINNVRGYTSVVCGVREDYSLDCWGYRDLYVKDDQAAFANVVATEEEAKASITIMHGDPASKFSVTEVKMMVDAKKEAIARGMRIQISGVGTWSNQVAGAVAASASDATIELLDAIKPDVLRNRVIDLGLDQPPAGGYVQVATSPYVNCALGTDGLVKCWGKDCSGGGRQTCNPPPWQMSQISLMGGYCACGLLTDGRLTCWGQSILGGCQPP